MYCVCRQVFIASAVATVRQASASAEEINVHVESQPQAPSEYKSSTGDTTAVHKDHFDVIGIMTGTAQGGTDRASSGVRSLFDDEDSQWILRFDSMLKYAQTSSNGPPTPDEKTGVELSGSVPSSPAQTRRAREKKYSLPNPTLSTASPPIPRGEFSTRTLSIGSRLRYFLSLPFPLSPLICLFLGFLSLSKVVKIIQSRPDKFMRVFFCYNSSVSSVDLIVHTQSCLFGCPSQDTGRNTNKLETIEKPLREAGVPMIVK